MILCSLSYHGGIITVDANIPVTSPSSLPGCTPLLARSGRVEGGVPQDGVSVILLPKMHEKKCGSMYLGLGNAMYYSVTKADTYNK